MEGEEKRKSGKAKKMKKKKIDEDGHRRGEERTVEEDICRGKD
tara:strand:+ start:489 stop:617 length:129 start_codon:yes stop_codon:yes gene_type:complete